MFQRKPKVLTPAEMEVIRTKDFFDCILPGTIKFLSDHYIVGDTIAVCGQFGSIRLLLRNRQSSVSLPTATV